MTNVLVTGGAGFIGSNMVRFLLEKGYTVRVLDNFETGKQENLTEIADQIELLDGDIRDEATAQKSAAGMDVVLHLAALGSVPRSLKDPKTTHDVNVSGTFNMLEASREALVKRFILASSSSVYGQSEVLPQHEGLPLAPISPYGATKAVGEIYCKAFYESYRMETICLRYYNVFGPRQDPNSQYAAAIPLFVSALLRDESPIIFDDGEQTRGFTYIENVMQANWLAATVKHTHGEAINISTSTAVSVNTVVKTIRELLGKGEIEPKYKSPRLGDIKHSLADVSQAEAVIGYKPVVSFDEGIRQAIDWYKDNLS